MHAILVRVERRAASAQNQNSLLLPELLLPHFIKAILICRSTTYNQVI